MRHSLYTLKKVLAHRRIRVGIILVMIPILLGLSASWMAQFDPELVDPLNRLKSINSSNWMGTDNLGRDVFTRSIYGIQISLLIGVLVTSFSLLIGVILGLFAAYFPKPGNVVMRLLDGVMAFPTIILAIAMAGILGEGVPNIIIALAISSFPSFARLTRERVTAIRATDYVASAIVTGKGNLYIIRHYIMPNIIAPLIVQATFIFAMSILNESILSFLGVGIKAPTPSLGGMVSDARSYMMVAPWMIAFPGLIISWIVLSINLMGDGLRDVLDPHNERL